MLMVGMEETVYHDINDMYDYALKAGYQTVFIQLYDAAGKGSASQWDNGKLLAQNWKKYIIISVKS